MQTNIDTTFYQTVAVAASNSVNFTILSPFTPDEIRVSCAINAQANGADYSVVPIYSVEGGADVTYYYTNNILECQSNMFPGTLCLCNVSNTYNPVYTFFNNSRNNFNGTFNLTVTNLTTGNVMTAGIMVLQFQFIRYK
jgi:hypothetical protein